MRQKIKNIITGFAGAVMLIGFCSDSPVGWTLGVLGLLIIYKIVGGETNESDW